MINIREPSSSNQSMLHLKKMKTILKITFLILAFCGGTRCMSSQTLYETFEQQRPFIGSSNPAALNINHPNGTLYQDIKRSIGLIHIIDNGNGENPRVFRNFVLINNTRNNKRPLVLMASLQNYYDFDDNIFDEESNIEFEAYATLDYEFAHGSNSGDDEQDAFIGKIYPVKLRVKAVFDIVTLEYELLEIVGGDGKDKLLQNAYAAGFNISPNPATERYILAGHSGKDHKKLSDSFTAKSSSTVDHNEDEDEELDDDELEYSRTLFFVSDNSHPNFLPNAAPTDVDPNGTPPTFDSHGQLVGFWNMHQWYQNQDSEGEIKALIGAWFKNQDKILGLLDPDDTHLTKVPGGYLNNQIPVDKDDLDLVLGGNDDPSKFSTPGIDPNNENQLEEDVLMIKPGFIFTFSPEEENEDEEDEDNDSGFIPAIVNEWLNLVPGIKRDIIDDSPVVLSVFHLDKETENGPYIKRLIYGGYLTNEIEDDFSAIGWNCDDQEDQQMYGACNRIQLDGINDTGMSNEFRSSYFSAALRNLNVQADGNAIVSPLDHAIPIQVELKNIGTKPVNVHAIRYPGEVATNALQLFKPDELKRKFDYIKYDENRGNESDNYHIESISIYQTLEGNARTIETGDNGGYLNLVNPVYKIGPIKTSIKEKNTANSEKYDDILPNFVTIKIVVHNPNNHPINLGVWIDYFNTEELGGVDNNANSYGFVNDGSTFHWIENVKSPYSEDHPNYDDVDNFVENDNNSSTEFAFTIKMPDADEIDLDAGETRTTRLRIGIYHDPTATEIEPYGVFQQGEVEDYMIEITTPSDNEMRQAQRKRKFNKISFSKGEIKEGDNTVDNPDLAGIDRATDGANDLPYVFGGGNANQASDLLVDLNNLGADIAALAKFVQVGLGGILFDNDEYGIEVAEPPRGGGGWSPAGTQSEFTVQWEGSAVNVQACKENPDACRRVLRNNTTTSDDSQILYEQGGEENGFSILKTESNVQFGVRINGRLELVKYDFEPDLRNLTKDNTEPNPRRMFTTTFKEGVMKLYVNGELIDTNDSFVKPDQEGKTYTQIPRNSDKAGIGATRGKNIWRKTTSGFSGLLDYFGISSRALTDDEIKELADSVESENQNNTKQAIVNSKNPKGKEQTKTEAQTRTTDFSIFPNPAKDKLNIIVEIQQAGELSINIFDLSGKQVYDMQEPQISEGHQLVTLRNLKLSPGQYIVKVKAGDVSQSEQVVFE